MKTFLFIAAITAHLLSVVYPHELLHWIISILSVFIVIVVFKSVNRFVQSLGLLFVGLGVLLLIISGAQWMNYLLSFGIMLNILSLFALIPIIALPIELGNYALRVQAIIQRSINHSGFLYSITSFLSYILSSFMGLATLPMMYHTIRPSLELYPIKQKERFMSRAITHGYSMPIIWTPVAPIVGIIVEMTGVSWSEILPILIPFSLLGLILDWVMGIWISNRRQKAVRSMYNEIRKTSRMKATQLLNNKLERIRTFNPLHIFIAILIFNTIIAVMEMKLHYGFLFLVSVVVIPFSFFWSLLIGKGKEYILKSRTTLIQHVLKMNDQFFIFLCAGFFISVMQSTDSGHTLNSWIISFKDMVGTDVFILLIPLIPFGLAFFGLHPAVGLALTAESLNPQLLGISVELTAIAMLTGAAMAFLMGPYNATAGIMSNLINDSSYRVSNWNGPFTFAYFILVMILLLIIK
jgi:hypothetical protein